MMVRRMTAADIEAVAQLEAQTFSMPWSVNGFADTLGREDVIFLVACEDEQHKSALIVSHESGIPCAGNLLGYVGVYCAADEGEITNVAVAPSARKRGVATALLVQLKEQLARRKISRIVLEVRVSNEPAIHLYEKQGFQIEGKRKNFYEKPTEDAYVMVFVPVVYYGDDRTESL